MTDDPENAQIVASRLWEVTAQVVSPRGDTGATAEQLLVALDAGLRRWIGAEGYAVLLGRCVADTLPSYPALAHVPDLCVTSDTPAAVPPAGADGVQSAMIALLEAMMRQLSGVIGWELAIRLVETSGTPSTRGTAGPELSDTLP